MTSKSFIYQDALNTISSRHVINIVDKGDYFQGYCLSCKAVRNFKYDRVLEYIDSPEYLESLLPKYREKRQPKQHKLEICFTGFKESDKSNLKQIAKNAGMIVRTSVTGYLDILCCGFRAGPKKIEKSKKMQVIIMTEEQFMNMIETGEMPNNP